MAKILADFNLTLTEFATTHSRHSLLPYSYKRRVLSIVTDNRPNDLGLITSTGKNFIFNATSNESIKAPTQLVKMISPRIIRPEREFRHSHYIPSMVENQWICISSPPYSPTAWRLIKHRNSLNFNLNNGGRWKLFIVYEQCSLVFSSL